jgi:hypothetical protein
MKNNNTITHQSSRRISLRCRCSVLSRPPVPTDKLGVGRKKDIAGYNTNAILPLGKGDIKKKNLASHTAWKMVHAVDSKHILQSLASRAMAGMAWRWQCVAILLRVSKRALMLERCAGI